MKKLVIGTRGSLLALKQAEWVRDKLLKKYPHLNISLLVIKTCGDHIQDSPLSKLGGEGIFVKELQEALLSGKIDLAVHSLKDVPIQLPKELKLAAILKREEWRDAFVSLKYKKMSEMKANAVIGTSSIRRKMQLLHTFPNLNLKILDIRGNVDTRLKKLKEGEVDALIMSAQGLKRLGWSQKISEFLDFVPAPGQGVLCIEISKRNSSLNRMLSFLNDPKTSQEVELERFFLKTLGGGCQIPLGVKAKMNVKRFFLKVFFATIDDQKNLEHKLKGNIKDAKLLIKKLAKECCDEKK